MKTMKKNMTLLLFALMPALIFAQPARQKIRLDTGWSFHLGDVDQARNPDFDHSSWRKVSIPHDWSIEGEFSEKLASCTAYLPGGIGWYRTSITVPDSWKGKSITLEFDGVYNNSEVWINGHYLGWRPNGYISFYYPITPYLKFGEENIISVRVDHSQSADTRWYSGSGIYRNVWLHVTHPIHVAHWGTFVTTPEVSTDQAIIAVETTIASEMQKPQQVILVSDILTQNGVKVASRQSEITLSDSLTTIKQPVEIQDPVLWDIEHPHQYTLKTRILQGSQLLDEFSTVFGIRTMEFNPETGFWLNGRNIKMKGVCLHHDGGCVGAAVPIGIWEYRLEKLKKAGCNAIRTSHNPPDPEFLDLCDRMGFLVMDEAFDEWEYPKRKWIDGWNESIAGQEGYARYFREWAMRDLEDLIRRDKNHPSVIMWSIGNEIDYANDPYADLQGGQAQQHRGYSVYRPDARRMVDIATAMTECIKSIDTTRPVTMALANIANSRRIGLPAVLDIVGYNYTEGRYESDHVNYPDEFIYGSENPHYYRGWLAVKENPYISAQFLWTGVDYLGEAAKFPARSAYSGLLDLTGHEKSIYYWRQSMWSDEPMLYLTARKKDVADLPEADPMDKLAWFVSEVREGQNWNYQPGDTMLLIAYTNNESAELFVNGRPFGKKIKDPANSSLWWYLPYEPGEVTVVSFDPEGHRLESSIRTSTEPTMLDISTNSPVIDADNHDVSIVEVVIRDKNGNQVYLADNRVDFEVKGAGRIIGTDNGDARCLDNLKLPWRKAYRGRCIAVIQSNGTPGEMVVTARVAGLPLASVTIHSQLSPKH